MTQKLQRLLLQKHMLYSLNADQSRSFSQTCDSAKAHTITLYLLCTSVVHLPSTHRCKSQVMLLLSQLTIGALPLSPSHAA